jgi:hypothetical protein
MQDSTDALLARRPKQSPGQVISSSFQNQSLMGVYIIGVIGRVDSCGGLEHAANAAKDNA